MDTSPFLIHLRRLFKIVVGYDVKKRKFNLWIVCSLISNTIALGTTFYKFNLHKVPKKDLIEQLTLTAGFTLFLLNSASMLRIRKTLGELIEDIFKPVKSNQELKVKECKSYTKWINLIGVFFFINLYLMLCCLTATINPLVSLMFSSETLQVQDFPLFFGWIPFYTESYVVYGIAFFIGTISNFGGGIFCTFHMTMNFALLKIKLRMKLLAEDIRNIDDIVISRAVYRMMQLPASQLKQVTPEDKKEIYLICRNNLMKELIESHLEIIRSVKLVNDCYSLPMLIFAQASSLIAALMLPRGLVGESLPILDTLFLVNGGIGVLVIIGLVCNCGQMIEDESDNIRRAFYEYSWYCEGNSFRNSLRTMMIVASRPLRLTAGGIYPLNRETFICTCKIRGVPVPGLGAVWPINRVMGGVGDWGRLDGMNGCGVGVSTSWRRQCAPGRRHC
ncbi:uncharacterized protein LOC124355571 [Homalodisca vitripennis]|uniref:uncharacterized protein LOC124355571 n=1 Tax=Homalodisca vitripennis TaxID=197043 RepID=UPI001EEBBED9|nr:uncharacterized protein LOC124355571 [Homalodisca vitripennis]